MPRRPDLPCADCGKLMWSGRSSLPAGKARCSECRRSEPAYRTGKRREGMQEWDCGWCGKHCTRPWARGTTPKWCASCRDMSPWKMEGATCRVRKRPSKALVHIGPIPAPIRTTEPEVTQCSRGGAWWTGFVSGPCSWCGENFTAVTSTNAERYCSNRCARQSGKARHGGRFLVPSTFRLAIYERDSWTCQLCLEPVDAGAHYLSDWAPSLDHIVPQSRGGSDDASNLRTAHRWCNSVLGDGSWVSIEYFAA